MAEITPGFTPAEPEVPAAAPAPEAQVPTEPAQELPNPQAPDPFGMLQNYLDPETLETLRQNASGEVTVPEALALGALAMAHPQMASTIISQRHTDTRNAQQLLSQLQSQATATERLYRQEREKEQRETIKQRGGAAREIQRSARKQNVALPPQPDVNAPQEAWEQWMLEAQSLTDEASQAEIDRKQLAQASEVLGEDLQNFVKQYGAVEPERIPGILANTINARGYGRILFDTDQPITGEFLQGKMPDIIAGIQAQAAQDLATQRAKTAALTARAEAALANAEARVTAARTAQELGGQRLELAREQLRLGRIDMANREVDSVAKVQASNTALQVQLQNDRNYYTTNGMEEQAATVDGYLRDLASRQNLLTNHMMEIQQGIARQQMRLERVRMTFDQVFNQNLQGAIKHGLFDPEEVTDENSAIMWLIKPENMQSVPSQSFWENVVEQVAKLGKWNKQDINRWIDNYMSMKHSAQATEAYGKPGMFGQIMGQQRQEITDVTPLGPAGGPEAPGMIRGAEEQ